MRTFVRGLLGGLAAFWSASGAYAALQLAGVHVSWETLGAHGWRAAGTALLIGAVEESAKAAGIVLAVKSRQPREVFRATVAVAVVFGVGEALLLLDSANWPIAVSRAALSPVGHAALVLPFAAALAIPAGHGRAWRVSGALLLAAVLHGAGDWSLGHGMWGRIGFALSMLAPVLWLYRQANREGTWARQEVPVPASARKSAASPPARATQPRGA